MTSKIPSNPNHHVNERMAHLSHFMKTSINMICLWNNNAKFTFDKRKVNFLWREAPSKDS